MAGSPPVTAPVDPNEAFAAAAGPPPGANLPGGGPPTSAQVARAKPAATPVRPGSVGAAPDPNEAFAAAAGPPPGSGAQTTPIPQPGVEWSGHAPGPFPGMPTPPGQAQPYTFNGRQQPGPGVSGGRGFFFGDQQQQPGIAGQQQPGAEPHYTPTFVPPPGPPLPIDATPRAMQAQLSQEHQYIDIERKNLDQLAALGKQGKLSGQESVDYSARSQALSQRVTNYQALYAQYQQLPSAHIRPIAPHQYQQPPQLAALANAQAALKAAPDVLSPATFLALRQNVGLAWGPVTQTWAQRTARLNADAKDIEGAWAELKPLIAQDQKGELSPASHAALIRSARQLTMNQMAHDGMVDQQTQEIQAFTKWQKAHGDAPVHLGMAYPQEVANPQDPGLVRRTIDSISGAAARLLTPNDVAAQKNVPAARNALMLAGAYPPLPPLGQGPPAEIASLIRQKNDLVALVQAEKNGVTLPTHTLTQFQQNLLPTIRMQVDAEARAQQMAGTAHAFKADASALLVGALLGEIGAGLGGGLAARFIPRLLARGESGPLAAATARILARTTATTAGWGLGGPGGAGVSAYVMGPPPNYDPRTGKKIGGAPTTGQKVRYGIEQAGRAVVPSLETGAGVGLVGGVAGEIAAAAKTGFGRIYGWRPAPPAPGGTTVTPVATPALGPGEVDLGGGATYQPPPPETGPQAGPRFYDPKTGGIVESEGPVGNGTRLRVIDPGNAAGMGERTGRRWIALKGQMKDLQPLAQGEAPPTPTHTVYQNRLVPNLSIPAAGEPGVGGVGPDGEPQGAGVPKSFLGVPQEPGGGGTQIPGTRPVSPGMGAHVIVISPQGVDVDLRTRPLGDLQDFLSQYGAAHAQNGLTPEQQADYARTQKFLDAQNAYIRQQAAAPVTPEVSAAVTQALTKGGAERTNDLFALRRGIGEADRGRDPQVQDALHDAVREQTGLIVQDANQRLAPEAGTAPDQLVPPVRASAYRQLDPDQFAGLPPATRRALLLQDINNSRHVLDPAAPTLFSLPTGVRSESGLSGLADQLYQAAGLHLAAMFPAPIVVPQGTTPGSATGLGTPAQPGLGGVPSAVPPPATPTSTATSPPGAPPSPVTPTPATGAAPSTSAPPTISPTTGTTGGGNASGTLPITGSNLATPGAGAVTPSVSPAGRPPTVSPARPPASTTLPAISAASLPALRLADLKPGAIVQMVSNEALYGLIERAEQEGNPAWAVHIEDEPGSRTFGPQRGRILEARLLQPGAFVLAQAAPGAEPSREPATTSPTSTTAPPGTTGATAASKELPPASSERQAEKAASPSPTPTAPTSAGSEPAPTRTAPPPTASPTSSPRVSAPTATAEPKEPDLYPDDVKPGALLHNPLVGDVVRVLTTRRDRTLPGDQLDQAEIEYLQVPHPDGIQRGDRRWVTLQHLLDHYAPYAPVAGGLLPAEAPETTQRVVSAPGPGALTENDLKVGARLRNKRTGVIWSVTKNAPSGFKIASETEISAPGVPPQKIVANATIPSMLNGNWELAPVPEPENLLPETLRMLIDAITDRIATAMERGEPIFKNNIELETLAGSILGGSRAQGTYSAQTVYNALEAAVNRWVVREDFGQVSLEEGLARTAALLAALPTQSLRSGDKDALQQFSTPPSYAMLAAYALRAREGDSLLEPSAGTGSLLSMAMSLYGPELKERVANEIDPERRAILHDYFTHDTYGVDARYLNSTLPHGLTFDLILMNPPFSSAPGQRAANTNEIGFDHVKQALKRLRPGGRLVALLGRGASFERPTSGPFWRPVMENYHVIANMSLPGKDYEKYGTGFETQLVIIDNTGPTPNYGAVLTTGAKDAVEAGGLLHEHGAFERPIGAGVNAEVGPGPAAAPGTGGGPTGRAARTGRANAGGGQPGGREVLAPAAEPAGAGGAVPEGVPGNPPHEPGAAGEQPGGGLPAPGPVRAGGEEHGGGEPDRHVEPVAAPAKRGRPKKQEAGGQPETRVDVGEQYVSYLPAYVIEGRPHPAIMVETRSLAAVDPPPITVTHNLREEALYPTAAMAAAVGEQLGKSAPDPDGLGLSQLQLEALLYAKQRHSVILPSGERAGILIGDSTGAGKGRTEAAIIADAWESGVRRVVWFSARAGLMEAAKDDLASIGYGHIPVMLVNTVGASQHVPAAFEGVIFSTYNSLLGKGTQDGPLRGQTRRVQLQHWLDGTNVEGAASTNGDGALLINDESHKLKSAMASRGGPPPAAMAVEAMRLQNNLPLARVVYASATAMTDMENMGYLTRLGLWGKGTPWPSFGHFAAEFGGKRGKMEMVARDMKARGIYLAREISFKDPEGRPEQSVEFRTLTHNLSAADKRKYDLVAQAWQTALANFDAAIEITEGGKNAKRAAYSAFWSSHQRFFRQFLTALKLPSLYKDIDKQLAANRSVIISLIGTGEKAEEDAVRAAAAEGVPLDELDLTPIQALIRLVDRAFPTQQHVEELDPVGNTVTIPLFDADNEPVHNPEALAKKQELMGRLANITESLPGSPLNEILWHYGHGNVAEITGRDKRLEPGPNGETRRVSRGGTTINVLEKDRFNAGEKRIAIISTAANEGISLQAGRRFANQQRRVQYMFELNWSADQQMQANGRSHRSNQVSAPELVICSTDAGGEARFAATIAKRLASLGALTRGQREATGAGGMLDQFDFENDYGKAALEALYAHVLRGGAIPGLRDPRQALRDMSLLSIDHATQMESMVDSDRMHIPRFMNRLLSLEVDRQNPLFAAFNELFHSIVQQAVDAGEFDFGVQDIRGQNLREATPPQVVHTDPTTGAQTTYHHIISDEPTKPARLEMIDKLPEAQRAGFHQRNSDGTLFYVARTQSVAYPFRLMKPDNIQAGRITPTEMAESYTPVRTEEGIARARALWTEEEAAIPATTPHHYYLVAGSVLPVYDRLRSARQVNFDVKRATLPGNQRVVGISLAPNSYRAILRALGASAGGIDPADLFRELMQTGAEFPLVSGLSLKRSTRSGRPALMIQGAEYDLVKELQREMGTGERVNYNELVWVPSSPTEGPKKLAALLERFPPMAAAEGTATAPRVTGFTTAQGSTYTVDREGRTQRTKTPHAGHLPTDVGLKEASDRTYYVSDEDSKRAGMHGTLSGQKTIAVSPNEQTAYLASWNQAREDWGIAPSDRRAPLTLHKEPAVGLHPLEVWKTGNYLGRWHAGNAITQITTSAPRQPAPPPITRGLKQLQPQQVALMTPPRWMEGQPNLFSTVRWLEQHASALSDVFREAGRLGLTDEEQARAHDYGILLWPEIDNGKGKQPSFLAGTSRGQGLEGLRQEGQLEPRSVLVNPFPPQLQLSGPLVSPVTQAVYVGLKQSADPGYVAPMILDAMLHELAHQRVQNEEGTAVNEAVEQIIAAIGPEHLAALEEAIKREITGPGGALDKPYLAARAAYYAKAGTDRRPAPARSDARADRPGRADFQIINPGGASQPGGNLPNGGGVTVRSRGGPGHRTEDYEWPHAGVEANYSGSVLVPEGDWDKFKEWVDEKRRELTRVFPHLPANDPRYAQLFYKLLGVRHGRGLARMQGALHLKQVEDEMSKADASFFGRMLWMLDMKEDVKRQTEAAIQLLGGRATPELIERHILLPQGDGSEEQRMTPAKVAEMAAILAGEMELPENATAVAAREIRLKLLSPMKDRYLASVEELTGYKITMDREEYFHHSILDFARESMETAPGGKLKTAGRRTFNMHREGSLLNYNTNFPQAEMAWLPTMLYDTMVNEALIFARDEYDQKAVLVKAATIINNERMMVIYAEMASAMNENRRAGRKEITADDLYRKLNAPIARGFYRLGMMAAENPDLLPGSDDGRWIETIQQLGVNWSQVKEATDAGNDAPELTGDGIHKLWQYLTWLLQVGQAGRPGSGAAAMIFKGLAAKRAEIRRQLGPGQYLTWKHLLHTPIEGYDFSDHESFQPDEKLHLFRALTVTKRITDALMEEGARGLKLPLGREDLKWVTAMGRPKPEWVIPRAVARTLSEFQSPIRSLDQQMVTKATGFYKGWVLLGPLHWLPYQIRKSGAEFERTISAQLMNPTRWWSLTPEGKKNPRGNPYDPRYLIEAWTQFDRMYRRKEMPGDDLRAWMDRGGLLSTLSAAEHLPGASLNLMPHLAPPPPDGWKGVKAATWDAYWRNARLSSDMRDGILRYASFMVYRDQMLANKAAGGQGRPLNWGGSYPDMIMPLPDILDRAYALSNELMGAYDQVPAGFKKVRDVLPMPWLSFFATNFTTNWRIMQNQFGGQGGYDEILDNALENLGPGGGGNVPPPPPGGSGGGGLPEDDADERARRAAWEKLLRATRGMGQRERRITLRNFWRITPLMAVWLGRMLLSMYGFQAAVMAYNWTAHPDEERKLPPWVRWRPHFDTGTIPGTKLYGYYDRTSAFGELGPLSSVDNVGSYLARLKDGRMTFWDVLVDIAKFQVNLAIGEIGLPKFIAEEWAGRQAFPDAFDSRAIQDRWQYAADAVGMGNVYKALWYGRGGRVGLPQLGGRAALLGQATGFKYFDPAESQYNESREMALNFGQAHGLPKPQESETDKSNNAYWVKKSWKVGDRDGSLYFLARYWAAGGNDRGWKDSLKTMYPLDRWNANVKREFLNGLKTDEAERYRAGLWYVQQTIAPDLKLDPGEVARLNKADIHEFDDGLKNIIFSAIDQRQDFGDYEKTQPPSIREERQRTLTLAGKAE